MSTAETTGVEKTASTNDSPYLLIKHEDAVMLLVSVGFKTADKWDREKLLRQLNENYEELADGVKAEELDELVRVTHECILEAIKAKKEIKIEGGAPTPKENKKAEKAKEKTAKAPKEPKAAKAPKEPKPPKEKKERAPNIAYHCGVVLKKHGMEKGITPEMLADLAALRAPEPLPATIDGQIKWSWAAISGYSK